GLGTRRSLAGEVQVGPRLVGEARAPDVADDADDLGFGLAELDVVADGAIAIEKPPGDGLTDDDDRRAAGPVPTVQEAAVEERNLECLEVAAGRLLPADVRWAFSGRRGFVGALEGHGPVVAGQRRHCGRADPLDAGGPVDRGKGAAVESLPGPRRP